MTDYVLIALKGTGKVIITDAPVQSSDWGIFYETSGYKEVIEFYQRNRQNVCLLDLRHFSAKVQGKIVIRDENKIVYEPVVIDLGVGSAFASLSEPQARGLRIIDNDNRIMEKYHTAGKHEYAISSIALEADIIINISKIKTHRLAGMTGALKNIVGVNTDKDYLPHYRKKTIGDKGDQHRQIFVSDRIKDVLVDLMNQLIEEKRYNMARIAKAMVAAISRL